MNKNIIIVGAGPNLSFGVADKFGANNFSIGLISRNEEKLKGLAAELILKGFNVKYAVADASNTNELENALLRLNNELGGVDVLLYNATHMKFRNIMDEKTEDLVEDFKLSVANAFHSVKTLQEKLKESKGAVLFTGGGLATHPNVQVGSLSIGKAALKNLALQLHEVMKVENIYVGTLTVNNAISKDSETHSPKILAEMYWEMYEKRSDAEIQY